MFKYGFLFDFCVVNDWLVSSLSEGARVGVDPFVFPLNSATELTSKLTDAKMEFAPVKGNLIDEIWEDQPAHPCGDVIHLPDEYAGQSAQDKLTAIRKYLADEGASLIVFTALDEIAWLLNIRGSDIDFNPVTYVTIRQGWNERQRTTQEVQSRRCTPLGFSLIEHSLLSVVLFAFVWVSLFNSISYCIVTPDRAVLCIDSAKLNKPGVSEYLESLVSVAPYDSVLTQIAELAEPGSKICLDPATCNFAVYEAAQAASDGRLVKKPSPIVLSKAIKNPIELSGMRACQVRDAAALIRYFSWYARAQRRGGGFGEDKELQ